ncbi:uncharacterized protein LOC122511709 [Leptopilina heterotoma]|uniref:uncharacterized protein LOC122511709 n=1 Tax=Leptopilina heterotoma TaxID=63436 RepID=UPI001CA83C94|nr:uncharacterized protein LOC122511709 [Leptopilina heterotoma]
MRCDYLILFLINISLINALGIISGNWENITCFKFDSLDSCLGKLEANTTSLKIENSRIIRINRRAFLYYQSLHSLSINNCGIRKIDREAFDGLSELEKLDLSENELILLEFSYLSFVPNLKYLDVSFNKIEAIDDLIIYNLNKLETFYFDYNKISAISNRMLHRLNSELMPRVNLRRVKFGRNPLNWEYQTLLTRKFDDLNINYQDDWDNWNWLSKTLRDCQENESKLSMDQVMNCAIRKLLNFAEENFNFSNTPCVPEASKLIECSKGNVPQHQEIDGIRYAVEGLGSILRPMEFPQAQFHTSPNYKSKLDYQVIRYNGGKSDWAWFEGIISKCSKGAFVEEQVLDCEVQELLNFAAEIFENSDSSFNSSALCSTQVDNLLQCSKVSDVIDEITVRRSIQGFQLILQQTDKSLQKLEL